MSLGTHNDNYAFDLAPHQLNNEVYNAFGSCSPFILPPAHPLQNDSAVAPTVDCQAAEYWNTPRRRVGIGGSMAIYGGYRQYADAARPAIPAMYPIGPPREVPVQTDYFGCPTPYGPFGYPAGESQ